MYSAFGMRWTCDYIAIYNLAFGLIIFAFNCGPFVFSENRDFNKKLRQLKKNHEKEESNIAKNDLKQSMFHSQHLHRVAKMDLSHQNLNEDYDYL